jgi:large subunit ribosomal protein L18
MNRLTSKVHNLKQRQHRVRARTRGNVDRPRLSVYVSNQHVTAQIIDDFSQTTLVYASSVGKRDIEGTMTDRAKWVGGEIAKKAKAAKIKKVVFDRGGKLYHGRVKALAEAAREAGLGF